jgi:hypothetical protein
MHRLATALAILLPIAGVAPVHAEAAPMPDCHAPEHRQFDFWLGHWRVTAGDKVAGDSRIESILDGCAIAETWTGTSGNRGRSLNLYNRETGQWEQFWIDSQGGRLLLRGGLHDGAMVMEGIADQPDAATGIRRRERITWSANADGSVRQLWEASTDDGKTWNVEFDGRYVRVEDVDRVD